MHEAKGNEEWTNAIDRGGLWHVSNETYLTIIDKRNLSL